MQISTTSNLLVWHWFISEHLFLFILVTWWVKSTLNTVIWNSRLLLKSIKSNHMDKKASSFTSSLFVKCFYGIAKHSLLNLILEEDSVKFMSGHSVWDNVSVSVIWNCWVDVAFDLQKVIETDQQNKINGIDKVVPSELLPQHLFALFLKHFINTPEYAIRC